MVGFITFWTRLFTICEDCGEFLCPSWVLADPEEDHKGPCGK